MSEPVSLTFIFQTIGVVLLCTAFAVVLVKYQTTKIKED